MMFIYYQLIYQDTASRLEILIGLVVLCECDKNIYVKDMQNPFFSIYHNSDCLSYHCAVCSTDVLIRFSVVITQLAQKGLDFVPFPRLPPQVS